VRALYIIISICCLQSFAKAQAIADNTNYVQPYLNQDTLLGFLSSHIIYPQEAKTKNIGGTVKVQFIVETDGSISNIKALNEIPYLTVEALRVVAILPRFNPGTSAGKVVRMMMVLPINFSLE